MSPLQLQSVSSNPTIVGGAWLLSSSLFSTYYTTAFLKHDEVNSNKASLVSFTASQDSINDFELRQERTKIKMTSSPVSRLAHSISTIPRPTLLTLYRFIGSLLLGLFVNPNVFGVKSRLDQTLKTSKQFILPAIFLFTANFFNSIALDRIGISLTYICKCAIPLITVVFTFLSYGIKSLPNKYALMSLIPITLGVAVVSWDSPTFEKYGFVAALISCTAQAALNLTSKSILMKNNIDGIQAQRSMAAIASILALFVTSYDVIRRFINTKPVPSELTDGQNNSVKNRKSIPSQIAFFAVAAYHVEYVLSFMFVKLVEPVTFGTSDAFRRLSIIIAGHKMFDGTPFSRINLTGMACALLGFLGYSLSMS